MGAGKAFGVHFILLRTPKEKSPWPFLASLPSAMQASSQLTIAVMLSCLPFICKIIMNYSLFVLEFELELYRFSSGDDAQPCLGAYLC